MSRDNRKRWDFGWRKASRFKIGPDSDPMLIRWRLLQTPLFGIYVHFIYREDLDRVPHDHPWRFWSLILRGGYQEEYVPDVRYPDERSTRSFTRGGHHLFPLTAAHRIIYVRPHTTTLCLVGRKVRSWGFYDTSLAQPFVDYRDALDLRPTEGVSGTGKHPATPLWDVRSCRSCGCTEDDCTGCIQRTGSACYWIEQDLCSACTPHPDCMLKHEIHLAHPVSDRPGEPWCQGVRDPDADPELERALTAPWLRDGS